MNSNNFSGCMARPASDLWEFFFCLRRTRKRELEDLVRWLSRERQIVLLHLLVKERAVNTEGLRSACLVVIHGLKRIKNGLSFRPGLNTSEGSIAGRTRSSVRPMNVRGKI